MKITIVIIAAVLAVTQGTTSPPSTGGHTDNSLLYNLLQVAGFSDSCVSGMLDYCSTTQQELHLPSLIQEVLDVKAEVQDVKVEVQEVKDMVQQLMQAVIKNESRPRHCMDLLDSGDAESGQREVYPYSRRPNHPVTVYCDQDVDGGGWTVFQRRTNKTVRLNFSRNWTEYEAGFGNVNGKFWLGLDVLHQLTTSNQELRIDLYDYEGEHRWAKYGTFQVDSADTNYRLTVERYSGDAGDSMAFHNGQEFSTHDSDHDRSSGNCAESFPPATCVVQHSYSARPQVWPVTTTRWHGGWWYNACHRANLNGYQHVGANTPSSAGIMWRHWRGWEYSLRRTTMMARPTF